MPRRKAAANEEMDDTNEQQPPVVKRAKAANKHAAIVLAIDVGSNSAICSNFMERETDLQRSLQIADWIISRKLFTESKDQFSIVFFGHESTTNQNYPNVYVHNPEFDKARVEWLQMFKNEVQVNPKCPGDYLAALYTALDIMRFHAEDLDKGELEESTVILISNFSGLDEGDQVMEALNPVASAFRTLGTSLITIGTDLTEEPKSKAQKIGHHFIRQLFDKANQIDGSAYNFQEGLSKLKFFVPKPKPPRGQPFNLELGKDFSIRVQMYLKNSTEVAIKLKFDPVSGSSAGNATNGGGQHPQQLKQVRRYETIADEGKAITFADIDQAPDVAFSNQSTGIPTGKIVEKANIVKGYRYGKSLIPFDKDVQKMVEIPEKCKQLQLLQFTSRDNILPQFLMSNTRYILPHKDAKSYDKTAHNTFSALVMAMLEMNVVALCRYSYNVNSNPKLVCLMPKMTKAENYPVLIHYELPFRDDFRYFNFPPMSQDSDFQEEAYIDNYIDTLMLSAEDGSTEMLKKKDVHDPRTQYQCMTLREKALNPEKTIELTPEDKATLLEMLSPPKKLMKKASEAVQQAKDIFKLELNAKTRMALFKKPKAPSVLVGVDDSLQPILASLDELKPLNGNDVEEGDDKKAKKENARKESME